MRDYPELYLAEKFECAGCVINVIVESSGYLGTIDMKKVITKDGLIISEEEFNNSTVSKDELDSVEVTANSLMWKLFMDLPVSVKSRFKLSV